MFANKRDGRNYSFILLVIFLLFYPVYYVNAANDENITEVEFAKKLVKIANLTKEMPQDLKPIDYINALRRQGIEPLGGWEKDKLLTWSRLSYILVRLLQVDFKPIGPQELCNVNLSLINKLWYQDSKVNNGYKYLDKFLFDQFGENKPSCPYGEPYKDANGDYLVDSHVHEVGLDTKKHAMELFSKVQPVIMGEPDGNITYDQVDSILSVSLFDLITAEPYLTSLTPIMPEIEENKSLIKGRINVAIYEKGSASDRVVSWNYAGENKPVHFRIFYANDGSLPKGKTLVLVVNDVEIGSSKNKWDDLSTDKYFWIGAQSQTGSEPADAYISNIKTYRLIDTVSLDFESSVPEDAIQLYSKLDSPESIMLPKEGAPGVVPQALRDNADQFFSARGFLSNKESVSVAFPMEKDLDRNKAAIEFDIAPKFSLKSKEFSILSNVDWKNNKGAEGIYIYYEPVQEIR